MRKKITYELRETEVERLRKENEQLKSKVYSSEIFISVFEHLNDVIYKFSVKKRKYEFISPKIFDMLGYKPDELRTHPSLIRKIVHPDFFEYFKKKWKDLMNGTSADFFELKVIKKSGEEFWIQQRNIVQKDEFDKPLFIEGIITDISEKKNTELTLQKKSELLNEAQRQSKIGNWVLSEGKRFIEWSDEMYNIFELTDKKRLPGFDEFIEIIHPADREKVKLVFTELLAFHENISPVGFRIRYSGKKIKYLRLFGKKYLKSDQKTLQLYGTIQDITDKVDAEYQISQSETRFRNIFNSSPMGIHLFSLNTEGKLILTESNRSADIILGFKNAKILNKPIETAFPSLKNTGIPEIFINVACTGTPWSIRDLAYRDTKTDGIFDLYCFQTSPGNVAVMFNNVSERKRSELLIKKSEQNYRNLVDNSIVGVFKADLKGNILFVNQALVDMFGFDKKEDLLAIRSLSKITFDPSFEVIMNKLKRGEILSDFRVTTYKLNKQKIIIGVSIVLLENEISGMVIDKTEKVKANEELLLLNKKLTDLSQRYLNLINNTGTSICICNDDDVITMCNSRFEKISGYKKNEIEGIKKWFDFFLVSDVPFIRKLSVDLIKSHTTSESDFIFTRKNKEKKYIHLQLSAIPGTDEKIVSITDITYRKKIETALVKSEIEKSSFLNTLPHLAWLKDIKGRYITVNESFVKSRNIAIEDIIGKTDYDLYPKRIADKYDKEDKYLIKTGEPCFFEEKSKNKWYETFKAPLYDETSRIAGVTGISLEITNRKRIENDLKSSSKKLSEQNEILRIINEELVKAKENAEDSDRLKSAFLANMSHEIRTPMNAILGFAELLKHRKLSEERKKAFIDIINSKSKQLLQIITDIIDISKIEANQIKIYNKNFSLNELISQMITYFNTLKEQDKKKIHISSNPGMSDKNSWIFSDRVRIEQILTNLVSNAYKFTESGKIEIGYDIEKENWLVFSIKDTGIGLTEEEKLIIFDRFRQASSSFSRVYGGTGLGLSISKGLVEKMGGEIWVESEVNKGSTFFFKIPYSAGEREVKIVSSKEEVFNWENKVILVAEDEDINFNFIETLLKPTNAVILRAKNGLEAVGLCKKNAAINLVLMDIKLPELNGLDATREIKKFRKTLPVIAQTAYAMSSDEESCLSAGCDAYISKPIKIDPFMKMVQQFL